MVSISNTAFGFWFLTDSQPETGRIYACTRTCLGAHSIGIIDFAHFHPSDRNVNSARSHNSHRWRILQPLLAVAMVAAFVVCGLHGLKKARSHRTDGIGVLNSTDSFLLQALRVNGGAEKILSAISDLPPLQPLAIIAPKDNIFGPILLPTIGSITWPHQVYLIQAANPDVSKSLDTLRNDHFAAALVYDLAPPVPDSGNRRVGALTIVRVSK